MHWWNIYDNFNLLLLSAGLPNMTLYRLAAKQNYEQNHIKSLPKYLPQNLDQICLDNFFRRIRTVLRANLTNRISNVVYPAVCVNHLMVCDIEKLVEFIINALKKIHFKNKFPKEFKLNAFNYYFCFINY